MSRPLQIVDMAAPVEAEPVTVSPAPTVAPEQDLSDEHGGRGGHARLGDFWPTSRIADWLESIGL